MHWVVFNLLGLLSKALFTNGMEESENQQYPNQCCVGKVQSPTAILSALHHRYDHMMLWAPYHLLFPRDVILLSQDVSKAAKIHGEFFKCVIAKGCQKVKSTN